MRDTIAMAEAMQASFIEAKWLRIEVFIKTGEMEYGGVKRWLKQLFCDAYDKRRLEAEIEQLRQFPVPVFKFREGE